MRESSFGKYFSHTASVCTFVYWIDMSNVFLWHMVKKLRNGAFVAVSPSVDLGPPVPEAPRVCLKTPLGLGVEPGSALWTCSLGIKETEESSQGKI